LAEAVEKRLPTGGSSPAPQGRRERNKQEKLTRIVGAAKSLFSEKGYDQTTTQQIAERADIGSGTLFLYAKSKEDLLILIFKDEMIAMSQSAFKALPTDPPVLDQLMTVFEIMMDYHGRDEALSRVLIKEISMPANLERNEDIQALMRVVYCGIGGLVANGQRNGEIRQDIDTMLAAEGLFASYYLGLRSWLSGATPRPLFRARLRKGLALFIKGLKVP
jgi:AcrR family transcriptional regulator